MRKLAGNLPLLLGLLLAAAYSLDVPFLRPLKTEETFGVWLLIVAPLAVLLVLLQLVLWAYCAPLMPWRARGDSRG